MPRQFIEGYSLYEIDFLERKTALVHPGGVYTQFQVPDCRCSLCAVPGRAPVPAQSMTQLWRWAGLSPGTRPPPAPPHHKQQVYSSHSSSYSSAASSTPALPSPATPAAELLGPAGGAADVPQQLVQGAGAGAAWLRPVSPVSPLHGAVCSTFPGWLTVTLLGD